MGTEIIVALIVSSLALIGTIITFWKAAKKDEVDALRGIIQELKAYVNDLEYDKEDLQAWAEKLVCQVKEAGLTPVRFVRRTHIEVK
jgi:outer membrane murein-binding lipoprotein Lpp